MSKKLKIITIGGGTGGSIIDSALSAEFPDLVSVVTTFDNGGSSGILRREFGMLPQGDIRRRIFAQKTVNNEVLEKIYNFRFDKDNSLETHSIGNLMILAATKIWGEKKGIEKICEMFGIHGKVLPVSFTHAELAAKLTNGKTILGEEIIGQTIIDKRDKKDDRKIEKVYLTRKVKLNQEVKENILNSDYIILCPGDFYSSLIPNFLVPGFSKAVKQAQQKGTKIIFVSNIMTKAAETKGFKLSDFVKETQKYLGTKLDYIIFNKTKVNKKLKEKYKRSENAEVVENDLKQKDLRVREVDMIKQNGNIRHDKGLFLKAFKNIVAEDKKQKIYVWDLDDTLINTTKYNSQYLKRNFSVLKLFKNGEKVLKKLSKEKNFLLTFDQHGLQQSKIDILNLKNYFKETKIVFKKTDKFNYLKALLEKYPEKHLYVVGDNHEDSELQYAKELGLKTICVALPGNKWRREKYHKHYDLLIEKEDDFLKILL